jgi:aspartate/methionine/tyrosine aminotransferase
MRFPDVDYIRWAKHLPAARVNLARSGLEACPPSLLRLKASDLVANLPVRDGYAPLVAAIARRYRVRTGQVFTVSGGTSFANFIAVAAALHDAPRGSEVIVERPAYEPLLRVAETFGRVRRFDRRFEDGFRIDLDRFAAAITPRTRLAIVSNLHNPSGTRTDLKTLRAMARLLARVGAHLLVDEVYLECLWGRRTGSCVHAGSNVIVTNSLTKAYGLDGLRAGWILGPRAVIARAARLQDLMANNGVAPGEQMALAAFRSLPAIRRRAQALLGPNLDRVREFLAGEQRLEALVPENGSIVFARLPRTVDSDALARLLLRRYSTLIVPGRFFELPRFIRVSFGVRPERLERGLRNLSRALDELERPV